jgi:D-alanine-D-alanine ligase
MDVLTQVEAIERSLESIGHPSARIAFTRDLVSFINGVKGKGVDIVLNLCETVDEDPGLAWHPPAVLELLGISFSGSPSTALMLTADKILTKQLLKASSISTPGYLVYPDKHALDPSLLQFPVIVKPRFEDASIGIDQESIFEDEGSLEKGLERLNKSFGALLVEEYISGREFNISVFGYPVARVLPIAEIDFSAFPEGLYPIVGYRAKWNKDSFEYQHTPRIFPGELPQVLLKKMEKTALECFHLFQLRDYGRVDLRLDDHDEVYVLEVNANPCLSPDAGLAASFQRSGMGYSELVAQLVDFTLQRRRALVFDALPRT